MTEPFIKYRPAIDHPVLRALTCVLTLLSLFEAGLILNHATTYSGFGPIEFMVFPVLLFCCLAFTIQIHVSGNQEASVSTFFLGFKVKAFLPAKAELTQSGKVAHYKIDKFSFPILFFSNEKKYWMALLDHKQNNH